MSLDWTRRPVRFFQHLLREADAIDLDVNDLIAEIKSVGANGCIAMGGGFSAWYPTRLSSQQINPHLSFDFLGAFLKAAKPEGVRVLVRMDISKGREGMELVHPDWFVQREDGSISSVWSMPQICATGPFWQNETFAILDEILASYLDVDGFFFNYLHVPRCHCPRCVSMVYEATGQKIPHHGIRSPAYETWRQDFLADYMGRVRNFIRERKSEAALVPYHHVHDGWDIARMSEVSDIIGSQISNPVMPNPVDPQPAWNHWAAEEALTARALKPGNAPLLIQTTSEAFASRQTAMPDARLVHNLIQAAAHGASTAPAVNGLLKQDDPRFVPALQELGLYQAGQARWYEGLRSIARIAIVKSEASRLWGPDAGRPAGAPDGCGHVAEFRGFFEMATDLRYPCDIVVAGSLRFAELERYEAILLPAIHCLSDDDTHTLDTYVRNGGKLIASADLAACDENGVGRSTPSLGCLPGIPGGSHSVDGAYFALSDASFRSVLEGIPHVAAAGDFWIPFSSESGNGIDLRLIGPFPNNAPEFTLVDGPGTAPGLIEREFGLGKAMWLPWRIGSLYHRFSMPEYRQLFGVLLETVAGSAPVSTTASSAVELICYEHSNGMVLHALNGATTRTKGLTELTPLAGFEITVKTDAVRAIDLQTGEALPVRKTHQHLTMRIDRLENFMAIAVPGGEGRGDDVT
ncbi:hypothetical protein ASC75_23965 [Aminobacter sp. DSM 101952]|uniref:alpha-amylase family protein n=1 Tax=Aminobacter sp. DSM 101952 TaxID=2735891 RepID=UPI0007014403|nr:alpha-amylase family protein [Aminobacter sp. DSM 101952]KQU72442.1 hypothetical protein ASC75_23965 [Aminobacter sp. DSM 101952]